MSGPQGPRAGRSTEARQAYDAILTCLCSLSRALLNFFLYDASAIHLHLMEWLHP